MVLVVIVAIAALLAGLDIAFAKMVSSLMR